jgi:hypothetical protein
MCSMNLGCHPPGSGRFKAMLKDDSAVAAGLRMYRTTRMMSLGSFTEVRLKLIRMI